MLFDVSDTAVILQDTQAPLSILSHAHPLFLYLYYVSMSFHAKENQYTKCSDAMVSRSFFKYASAMISSLNNYFSQAFK